MGRISWWKYSVSGTSEWARRVSRPSAWLMSTSSGLTPGRAATMKRSVSDWWTLIGIGSPLP